MFFAVSNIKEAIELKKAGIKGQILILGYTPIDQSSNLLKYDITQVLLSEKYAEDLMETEYSRAVTPQIRQAGNRLCEFTRVMFCLTHRPHALRCHARHLCL